MEANSEKMKELAEKFKNPELPHKLTQNLNFVVRKPE